MSPTEPPLAFTRYQRSPQRSLCAARRRSGLALRFTEPTSATAAGWKNSSRSARRVAPERGVAPGGGVTESRASAGRGLARQHREVEPGGEHAGGEAAIGVEVGAGDVAGRVAVEEDHDVALLLGCGVP